jgi:hypothetical protein
MEHVMGLLIGVCLSAACGFRVFVPMLATSLAAQYGYINLSPGFQWIGSQVAMYSFATATVLEVLAYYVPWLDNCLDALGAPIAVTAGIVLTGSMLGDVSPLARWSMAAIAGGGTAAIFHGGTAAIRAGSTGATGGLGNFLVSTGELIFAALISALAIVVPLMCLALIVSSFFLVIKKIVWRFKHA